MSQSDAQDGDHSDLADKLKHPFQELKDKLRDTHLHDIKISLIHKKYVACMLFHPLQHVSNLDQAPGWEIR